MGVMCHTDHKMIKTFVIYLINGQMICICADHCEWDYTSRYINFFFKRRGNSSILHG